MLKSNFKVFASCLLTKGASRSTIADLQNGTIKTIPNDLYDILTTCQSMTIEEIVTTYGEENRSVIIDYFQFLIKEEIVFLLNSDEIDLFPDIETTFNYPGIISNAILDFCNTSCYSLSDVIKQLDDLGCQHLQIRYFDKIEESKLIENCALFEGLGLRSVELVLAFNNYITDDFIEGIVNSCPRVTSIIIHDCHKFEKKRIRSAFILRTNEKIADETHCGFVNSNNFVANFRAFTESLHFNSCLNKKISVDKNGMIRNCPAMKSEYGNISNTKLVDAMQKGGYSEIWHIKKEDIEICRDCEFRHVCTDCRAFVKDINNKYSKPLKCRYDPYTTRWEK